MSVIAWDGKILATDRQVSSSNLQWKSKGDGYDKLIVHEQSVYAWTGTLQTALEFILWMEGDNSEKYPESMNDTDDWSTVLVWDKIDKTMRKFSKGINPVPVMIGDGIDAWGSGCYYALGTMHHSKNAIDGVKVAQSFDPGCGFGVTWYDTTNDTSGIIERHCYYGKKRRGNDFEI
jgi:hypothetical protein